MSDAKYIVSGMLRFFAIVWGGCALGINDWYFGLTNSGSYTFGLYPGQNYRVHDVVCDGASRLPQYQARCYATLALYGLGAILAAAEIIVSCCASNPTRRFRCVSALSVLSTLSVAIALTIYGVTMQHWYFCGMRYCEWATDVRDCEEGFGFSFYMMCGVLGMFVIATMAIIIGGCVDGSCSADVDHAPEPVGAEAAATAPLPAPAADPRGQRPSAPLAAEGGDEMREMRRVVRPPNAVVVGEVAGARPDDDTAVARNDDYHTWVERRDPDGRTFFECAETGATRWDRPEAAASDAVAVGYPEAAKYH